MKVLGKVGALVVLLWSLAGGAYAVMAYTPFTKIQFLDSEVVPATAMIARWHGVCAWFALVGAIVALSSHVTRRTLTTVGIAGALAAGALTLRPVLPELESTWVALAWCLLLLAPSLVLSVFLVQREAPDSTPLVPHAEGMAAWLAALASWAAGMTLAWQLMPPAEMGMRPAMALAALLILFGSVAAVRALVGAAVVAPVARAVALRLLGAGIGAFVMHALVLRAINFAGTGSLVVAATFGATVAFGLPALRPRPILATLLFLVVAVGAAVVQPVIAPLDWDFLGQRLVVIAAWTATFLLAVRATTALVMPTWILPASFITVLVLAGTLRVLQAGTDPVRITSWAAVDPSFAAVLEVAPLHQPGGDPALFRFLQERTGLPRSLAVSPYDVSFTSPLTPRGETPPHIFIIQIDSLRQDYLGAYDPAVTFTPSLDRFAADSLVFRRAFTRYGATGLSQPSLWVGGIMPHKQYVQPFAPMNALEKLLHANAYDVRMSYDIISHEILQPATPRIDLDQGVQNMDYRLCATLPRLTASLTAGIDRPVFAYTMPQDVHISTLSREGNASIDDQSYGGKFAPYASRVRRLDACFGAFVEELKRLGVYDSSIIIVTSDHGDSLGEGGRWGHAYTVFPEVMRVPLLVKLPGSMRGQWEGAVEDVAFTTDITPTLYRLLGYDVKTDDRFFGIPLVRRPGERQARSPRQLGASSYGPVYAVFDRNGTSLYILDAVNYRDHLFELGAITADDTEVTPTASQQADYQKFIRTRLTELHELYGIRQP